MSRSNWIETRRRNAEAVAGEGCPLNPVIVAAMAAATTDFGRTLIPASNNLLRLRAGPDWAGDRLEPYTYKLIAAGEETEEPWTQYRVYGDELECLRDYGALVKASWWGFEANMAKGNTLAFLAAVQPLYRPDGLPARSHDYFTDENYAAHLLAIARQYGMLARPEASTETMTVDRPEVEEDSAIETAHKEEVGREDRGRAPAGRKGKRGQKGGTLDVR